MASVQSSPTISTLTTGPSAHHDSLLLPESIGKRVDPTYSQTLHSRVKELLHATHNGFPGSQPVYFETKHLSILEQEDYFVCEKSNGVRCLLFFVHSPRGPAAFMLDRNQNWYYIPNILLPVRGRDNEYLKETLMDGELLMEKDSSKKPCQYSVFDLMVINGSSVAQRSFSSRLGMLKQDVIDPYKASLLSQMDPTKIPPFRIEHKKMERSYGLQVVFDRMSKLQHDGDGIIWTPVKCPYVPNICEKLLKWKPPEKNTADFRINAKWSKDHKPIYSLDVLSHVTYKFFDHFQPEPDWAFEWKDQPPDGKIAEFRYDPTWKVTIVEQGYAPTTRTGGWRFVRFRDDKDAATEENDVKKILHNIRDGVSKEQLLGHMQHIRVAWKAREKGLPPPSLSHLQTRGRLSISSGPGQSMTTPTGTSPVLPSPAVDSNMYGPGYFYRDHHKSRQNSIDSASTDRRLSATDVSSSGGGGSRIEPGATGSHHLEGNSDTTYNIGTQSLPGSRRQSLESSAKRDNNGNTNDDIERKRHKSLSELDKSRKQQLEDNKRQVKEHLEKTVSNDDTEMDSQATSTTSSPSNDNITKASGTWNALKSNSPLMTKHTPTPISPTKTMTSSHSLPTVFEEESTKLESPQTNTRLRKTTTIGDNGQRKLYAEKDDTTNATTNKLQKVQGATTSSPPPPSSSSSPSSSSLSQSIEYGSKNNKHGTDDRPSQASAPSGTNHDASDHLETMTKQQEQSQPHQPTYTSTVNTNVSRNGTVNEPYIDRHQNQGSLSTRYDPARSPPPQPSIHRSPEIANSQQHEQVKPPTPPSNSQPSSSHRIHALLTSSVEPIPTPPIKDEPQATTTYDQTPHSGASHSYKLSTILQEDSQQMKSDHGYQSNEHQQHQQLEQQRQHQQQQLEQQQQQQLQKNNQQVQQSRQVQEVSPTEKHMTGGTPNSSSPSTASVQFINFHADRPHSKGSPTSRQKTVFIQGEYHSNNTSPSNKVQSPKYTMPHQQHQQQQHPHHYQHPYQRQQHQQQQQHPHHQQQQHQWQQPSGSGMMSPQVVTPSSNKHGSHLAPQNSLQNSSTKSSPSSSPRGSRSGRQLDTWRVPGGSSGHPHAPAPSQYQNQHPPSEYHYEQGYPAPTSAQAGGYQHIPPHGYPPQTYPNSHYNTTMIHPEQSQHPSAPTPVPPPPSSSSSDRAYHLHQQSYRPPNEYHVDPSKNQHPNHHHRPPPPAHHHHPHHPHPHHPHHPADKQHYSNYTESPPQPPYPTSSNISPNQVTKRKSSKAKLDFILN